MTTPKWVKVVTNTRQDIDKLMHKRQNIEWSIKALQHVKHLTVEVATDNNSSNISFKVHGTNSAVIATLQKELEKSRAKIDTQLQELSHTLANALPGDTTHD